MTMRRLLYLIPVLVFTLVGVALAVGLTRDPGVLPSALLDRDVPAFELPPVPGRPEPGLASGDLEGPALVNVFASWCVPCRVEHPMLEALAEDGVTIHGINYKDRPEDVGAWLDELGSPFSRIGADRDGRAAIEWGVYGVPETFVVDARGRIVHRHVGPIMMRDLDQTFRPLLEEIGR